MSMKTLKNRILTERKDLIFGIPNFASCLMNVCVTSACGSLVQLLHHVVVVFASCYFVASLAIIL